MKESLKAVVLLLVAMTMGYVGGLLSQVNRQVATPTRLGAQNIVRAKAFELVDETGKTRGKFTMVKNEPCLSLHDIAEKQRGLFYLGPDGIPILMLRNAAENNCGMFAVEKNATILSIDDDKSGRIVLQLRDNKPDFYLSDEGGNPRLSFDMGTDGNSPCMVLSDAGGLIRTTLGASIRMNTSTGNITRYPESSLVFYDKTGKLLQALPK